MGAGAGDGCLGECAAMCMQVNASALLPASAVFELSARATAEQRLLVCTFYVWFFLEELHVGWAVAGWGWHC